MMIEPAPATQAERGGWSVADQTVFRARQGHGQLDRSGGFPRGQPEQRQVDAQQLAPWRRPSGRRSMSCVAARSTTSASSASSARLDLDDADAAHLDLAADGVRCAGEEARARCAIRLDLIVGHQGRGLQGGGAAPRQEQKAQGQVGLAGPGGPAQQRGGAPERHAGAVNELSCVGQAAGAPFDAAASAAGSRTVKRAPATPGGRRSLSAAWSSLPARRCCRAAAAVARPDAAAVGVDDLARDAQAEPGVLADRAVGLRPVGIEALEDVLELVRGMPGPSSSTTISISAPTRRALTVTAPSSGEKEMALSSRLVMTRPRRASWPMHDEGGWAVRQPRRCRGRCGAYRRSGLSRKTSTTPCSTWRTSTGSVSCKASSASSREALETSVMSLLSRFSSSWIWRTSSCCCSGVLA